MYQKVLLILKEIKDLIAFQLKEKISHKCKKANHDYNNNKKDKFKYNNWKKINI